MTVTLRWPALLAFALLLASAPGERPELSSERRTALVIQVQGARNQIGLIRITLFQSAEGFPEHSERAVHAASLELKAEMVEARFDDIAPGEWGIAVLHDENENGLLDRNFLGIPKEGVGASNDAVRFGLPSFEKARVEVPPEGVSLSVKLRYWM